MRAPCCRTSWGGSGRRRAACRARCGAGCGQFFVLAALCCHRSPGVNVLHVNVYGLRHVLGPALLQTAIVTGGNAGVGYATAEALLAAGSDVVLACRSLERAQDAAARLAAAAASRAAQPAQPAGRPASPAVGTAAEGGAATAEGAAAACAGRVDVELLDLASLDSVRRFASRWKASGRPLDLLVLNAGIMCPPDRLESADGFELQFQVLAD